MLRCVYLQEWIGFGVALALGFLHFSELCLNL
jgi:hypothetical protein